MKKINDTTWTHKGWLIRLEDSTPNAEWLYGVYPPDTDPDAAWAEWYESNRKRAVNYINREIALMSIRTMKKMNGKTLDCCPGCRREVVLTETQAHVRRYPYHNQSKGKRCPMSGQLWGIGIVELSDESAERIRRLL